MDDLPLDALTIPQGILSQSQQIFKSDLGKPGWSSDDLARQLGYSVLHGMDWAQTRTIAKNPRTLGETNPLLGEHPSTGLVNNYFAATLLGHWLLSNMLPPEYRKLFQEGTIGLEAGMAGRNKFKLGIGMTF